MGPWKWLNRREAKLEGFCMSVRKKKGFELYIQGHMDREWSASRPLHYLIFYLRVPQEGGKDLNQLCIPRFDELFISGKSFKLIGTNLNYFIIAESLYSFLSRRWVISVGRVWILYTVRLSELFFFLFI